MFKIPKPFGPDDNYGINEKFYRNRKLLFDPYVVTQQETERKMMYISKHEKEDNECVQDRIDSY